MKKDEVHFLVQYYALQQIGFNQEVDELLIQASVRESDIYDQILTNSSEPIDASFSELLNVVNRVSDRVRDWTTLQLVDIENTSIEFQNSVGIQAVFLIAVAYISAGVFTLLIKKPMNQLESAISNLGTGNLEEGITVGGPADLVFLGQKLEWLRKNLVNLNHQKAMFLRHVSHDLKSPLATIQESTSLLNDGIVGEPSSSQREILGILLKNTKKLQEQIDELLLEHSRNYLIIGTANKPIDLTRLIRKLVVDHKYSIRSANLSLKMNLPLCKAAGSKEQIRVAISNVISNAIRHSPKNGHILIDLAEENEKVIVAVTDEGPGVDPAERTKIFNSYYTSSREKTKGYKGSGLGLAIAKEYIETNEGAIDLDSRVGNGACFRITLPKAI